MDLVVGQLLHPEFILRPALAGEEVDPPAAHDDQQGGQDGVQKAELDLHRCPLSARGRAPVPRRHPAAGGSPGGIMDPQGKENGTRCADPISILVAGTGFEPVTFGL